MSLSEEAVQEINDIIFYAEAKIHAGAVVCGRNISLSNTEISLINSETDRKIKEIKQREEVINA